MNYERKGRTGSWAGDRGFDGVPIRRPGGGGGSPGALAKAPIGDIDEVAPNSGNQSFVPRVGGLGASLASGRRCEMGGTSTSGGRLETKARDGRGRGWSAPNAMSIIGVASRS